MAPAPLGDSLHRLGLSAPAARVYQVLLARAPVPLGEIERASGMGPAELVAAYAELVDAGLAASVADRAEVAAPLPPAAGLELLRRRRNSELDESGIALAGAFESFRRSRLAEHNDHLVEVVTGAALGARMRQIWASARKEIRQFDSPPYFPIPDGTADSLATLARGVSQRVVYSRASLTHPGYLAEAVEPCVAAGEQARVLPTVPVKLVIVDEEVALVSLSITEAEVHNTMLVVQPCGLFSALVALFEQCWQAALPLAGAADQPIRLRSEDRRLLALLAAGATDADIARELGMSRRTLFRRMEVLMARAGASTRFQLALQAQRRGWL